MKLLSLTVSLLLGSLGATASRATDAGGLYFGQTPPGDTPAVFAPGIISLEGRFEQFLLYSPDGSQLVFSVTNSDWSRFTLESLRRENGAWTEAAPAPFLGSRPDGLVACFSYDMRRAFFSSMRPAAAPPANIWMSERRGSGWSEPTMVGPPVSSDGNEWEVSIARSGTLYFSSMRNGGYGDLDLYRAPLVDGGYPEVENLGPVINSPAGDDLPYVAPDESYLVFGSGREGSRGGRDLYVSFRKDGGWTEPLSLGPAINSDGFDNYPSVSPDGKYLFFTRRKAWVTDEDSDIYWVGAGVLDRLREVALAGRKPSP